MGGSTTHDDDVSPVLPASSQPMNETSHHDLEQLALRADPDASATVTDFLDFTEHLPSDITRSLTLIAQLDETYVNAATSVNELTTTWSKLPALPPNERVDPVKLRADISDKLNYAMSARTYAHAEACRMQETVTRHHNRIQTILHKLRTMHENFPTVEEQALNKSPAQQKSPHMARGPKINLHIDGSAEKVRPQRIIVPGEVLGPHEVDFNFYSDSSDSSSEEESPISPSRPRIKLVKPSRRPNAREHGPPPVSTSTALARLKPPPDNAIPGSTDAPWLQLTPYELAKLRKRMKKNSQWIPSDTMIARELKNLGRGVEAFKEAEKKAEEEGRPFEPALPTQVIDAESGVPHPPEGAISTEALPVDEVQLSNRGIKLNEAKKIKRETLARMAAEEAEESARKMVEAARMFMNHEASPSVSGSSHEKLQETGPSQGKGSNKLKVKKRKRDSFSETPAPEKPQGAENLPGSQVPAPSTQSDKPPLKRTKTETPIPPPQLTPRPPSAPPQHTAVVPAPSLLVETPVPVPRPCLTKTPVPVPLPIAIPSESSMVAVRTAASSGQTSPVPSTVTTTVPTKPPAESPVPPPIKTSTTPILPPVREIPKRETRQSTQPTAANVKQPNVSRGNTPAPAPVAEQPAQLGTARRPASRGGKAASQEPPAVAAALALERSRRTSTARNTPAPEVRQPSKRAKRPAPGVVTTNSGGTSAIGKRKAAPRKKARGSTKKEKGASQQPEPEVEVEVDDDGNVIDPEEPRYCLCNRVSFGTMIQCDNVDNCEKEWFHLECVGLTEIPARTTKWYCPQCRILLNIGERGEVTSRGVKM